MPLDKNIESLQVHIMLYQVHLNKNSNSKSTMLLLSTKFLLTHNFFLVTSDLSVESLPIIFFSSPQSIECLHFIFFSLFIIVLSWRSVLLAEETGVPRSRENHKSQTNFIIKSYIKYSIIGDRHRLHR
jgi:hypothetical protein